MKILKTIWWYFNYWLFSWRKDWRLRLGGILFIFTAIVLPILDDGDATASLVFMPLGIGLLFAYTK